MMKGARVAAVAAILFWTSGAWADSPIVEGPGPERVDSKSHRFFAEPSKDGKVTLVFLRRKPKDQEIWRMPGWYGNAFLSDDGEYLTVGYPGNNLLDLDWTPAQVMLQFFNRGALIRRVPLSELIRDMKSLRRTTSHYAWGYYEGHVAPYDFSVETVEGRRLIFDVRNGRIAREEAVRPPR